MTGKRRAYEPIVGDTHFNLCGQVHAAVAWACPLDVLLHVSAVDHQCFYLLSFERF